jgi:6,7-dimethyl-8-ribityllumazine synthase
MSAVEAPHIMIVEARFYEDIANELVAGAVDEIEGRGGTYERFEVAGAFEIPAAVRIAIRAMDVIGGRRRFDGYVALGCVIRGETTHYDYVCAESARGLMDLSLEYSLALGYGILTVENQEQAQERAARNKLNKGGAVAAACLDMIELKSKLGLYPR